MENFQFDFERLKVYQKALEFIDQIFVIYRNLDRDFKYTIGSNLIRAGLSVANNLAEGNGKKSQKERARYFEISSDSAKECVSVFIVLKRQGFLEESLFAEMRFRAREITSMIQGLLK